MIKITEYWNKLEPNNNSPFGTKVIHGEYDIKRSYIVNNTLKDLKDRWKDNPKMTIEKDRITEDCGKWYGIHSYKIIEEV